MNQFNLVKQLAINALFWVGIVAIVLSLLAGSLYFLIFFAGLILFNFVIVNLLSKAQPDALSEIPSLSKGATSQSNVTSTISNGVLGFRLTPVTYPKVMDNELRDFAPEFISVNIEQNGVAIFSGNFARGALKQFRDGITQVLNVKAASESTLFKPPVLSAQVKTDANNAEVTSKEPSVKDETKKVKHHKKV